MHLDLAMPGFDTRWVGLGLVMVVLTGCVNSGVVPEEETLPAAWAERRVTVETFNPDVLAAGIFAETNRVRTARGLQPFRSRVGLARAAQLQAVTNAAAGRLSHHNPFEGKTTVQDRVRAQGLRASDAWENVASALLRPPPEGSDFVVRVDAAGREMLYDFQTGGELPWPTYAALARRIVQQWMDSPPHRANLLDPRPARLACAVALRQIPLGGEVIFSTQVFIAP